MRLGTYSDVEKKRNGLVSLNAYAVDTQAARAAREKCIVVVVEACAR